MVSDELVRPEHLRLQGAPSSSDAAETATIDYHITLSAEELSLETITAKILEMTLQRCSGNKSEAASLLKVNRKMFYR
jgi:DNA-binding protein Fis